MLGGVTAVAGIVAPEAAGRPLTVPVAIALMAIPALALLGAGLAPTAVGSRVDAVVVGVALAIGAPVAAALSTAIAVFFVLAMSDFDELAGPAVAEVIRMGVVSASRVAPLLAVVALMWVLVVRHLDRRISQDPRGVTSSPSGATDERGSSRPQISSPSDEPDDAGAFPATDSSRRDG